MPTSCYMVTKALRRLLIFLEFFPHFDPRLMQLPTVGTSPNNLSWNAGYPLYTECENQAISYDGRAHNLRYTSTGIRHQNPMGAAHFLLSVFSRGSSPTLEALIPSRGGRSSRASKRALRVKAFAGRIIA